MEYTSLLRVLLSFAFVIALMLGIAWLMRRFGLEKRLRMRGDQQSNLCVEDTLYLDTRHRVVILRRGPKRHVLMLGPQSEILLETYDAKENTDETADA